MAEFYAREGAQPDENGKYADFIGVVDGSYFIKPEGGMFMGVFMENLPAPGDEEYGTRLHEESLKIIAEYMRPYYENGTEISMEELDLVSPNYKGEGTEPIEQELASIESLCADESEDAGNGMRLFRMEDMGRYEAAGSDSGFEMEDGVLKGYAGSKKNIVIPDGTKEIGEEAFKKYAKPFVKTFFPKNNEF